MINNLTHSQVLQDVFALIINDYKTNGFNLDIGCAQPSYVSNSTLLQSFNWKSLCIDYKNYTQLWSQYPNSTFIQKDMTNKNEVEYVLSQCPNIIDFLSLDIDEYTLPCLKLIDLKKTRFKCITIEHNKIFR